MILLHHYLAERLVEHLTSAAAATAGVATAVQLSYIVAHKREDAKAPQYCIEGTRQPQTNDAVVEVLLTHSLTCDDKASAIATASAQMQKARAWLADDAALATFVMTLTEEQRTGWAILHNEVASDVDEAADDDQRHIISLKQTLICRVGPHC